MPVMLTESRPDGNIPVVYLPEGLAGNRANGGESWKGFGMRMPRIVSGEPVRAGCRPSCFAPRLRPAANLTLCATGKPPFPRKSNTRPTCQPPTSPPTPRGTSPKPNRALKQAFCRKKRDARIASTVTIMRPSMPGNFWRRGRRPPPIPATGPPGRSTSKASLALSPAGAGMVASIPASN